MPRKDENQMNTIRKIAIGLVIGAVGLLGVVTIGLTAGMVYLTWDMPAAALCLIDSCVAAFR